MQYIKHYYVNDENNNFCCDSQSPKYKRHPWKEYSGLSVKVWGEDSDGIDVCLSEVPDTTSVSTIIDSSGKNSVQVLTEIEYNSVAIPYFQSQTLFSEAQQAKEEGDEETATAKETDATTKLNESFTALRNL